MNKKGFVLVSSYMIVSVLLIIGVSFVVRSISEKRAGERAFLNTAVLNMAEAGIEKAWNWMRVNGTPTQVVTPASLTNQSLCAGDNTSLCGTYSVVLTPDTSLPRARVRILSQGAVTSGSYTMARTLNNVVWVDDYARYAYFSNTEEYFNSKVWFITNDNLNGPTMTNGQLHISGNPTFNDTASNKPVKMGYSSIDYMHPGPPPADHPQFVSGIEMNAATEQLPSKALSLRHDAAETAGLKLEGSDSNPTTVVLNSNGTMNVTNAHEGWTNYNMPIPQNGAIFVTGGDVKVSGTLNGRLTIGTNRNIVVTNNVTYADKADTNPATADVLGLIAEKDVVVDNNAPTDLEIDASIMALSKSFMVNNWDGPNKGTLTVYGGIIQRDRGPVGTFNSSTNTKVSGYSKNYIYDSRLSAGLTPPSYPRTNDYLNLYWQDAQYGLPAVNPVNNP